MTQLLPLPRRTASALSTLLLASTAASAQTPAPSPTPSPTAAAPSTPAASPADVASIEAILRSLYDVISGPAGKKRDWDRMRSLFIPGARLIPTGPQHPAGTPPVAAPRGDEEWAARVLDVEGFIERSSKILEEQGFYEREIARRSEGFGHILHVFSTYESRHKADDPKPFARGINSIQLMNDGRRWWVVSIFWEGETPQHPIPDKYLKSAP